MHDWARYLDQGIGCPGQVQGESQASKSSGNQGQVEQYNPGPGLQPFSLPAGITVEGRFAFSQRTRKMLVLPRLMRRFGKVSDHNGECFSL